MLAVLAALGFVVVSPPWLSRQLLWYTGAGYATSAQSFVLNKNVAYFAAGVTKETAQFKSALKSRLHNFYFLICYRLARVFYGQCASKQ